MRRDFTAAEQPALPRVPFLVLLGFGPSEAAWIEEARAAQMRSAAAAFPFALAAQVLAAAVAAAAGMVSGRGPCR